MADAKIITQKIDISERMELGGAPFKPEYRCKISVKGDKEDLKSVVRPMIETLKECGYEAWGQPFSGNTTCKSKDGNTVLEFTPPRGSSRTTHTIMTVYSPATP